MYNLLAIQVLEQLEGKKLSVTLEEITGVSERTWRNRIKHGWEPKLRKIYQLREQIKTCMIGAMQQSKYGWNDDEARQIIEGIPSIKAGDFLPTADLIYLYRPGYIGDYAESIAVASQFDRYCFTLFNAREAGDISRAKKILIEWHEWILRYFSHAEEIDEDLQTLKEKLSSAKDMANLLEDSQILGAHHYFLVLSCWDLEFCSQYSGGQAKPYPLFKLVMPCISPTVELNLNTNQLLRNGEPPKRGLFQKSVSRLLDFMSVLVYLHKNHIPPEKIPSVKEMGAWFKEDPSRISSWRDETTHLTSSLFYSLWKDALDSDKSEELPSAPAPMLVAAHLFRHHLTGKELFVCSDDYERWWKRNLRRLTAKGLKFGKAPWPKCLTDHLPDNKSPVS